MGKGSDQGRIRACIFHLTRFLGYELFEVSNFTPREYFDSILRAFKDTESPATLSGAIYSLLEVLNSYPSIEDSDYRSFCGDALTFFMSDIYSPNYFSPTFAEAKRKVARDKSLLVACKILQRRWYPHYPTLHPSFPLLGRTLTLIFSVMKETQLPLSSRRDTSMPGLLSSCQPWRSPSIPTTKQPSPCTHSYPKNYHLLFPQP